MLLVQPYVDEKGKVESERARQLTSEFILSAAQQAYPQGMERKDAKMFRSITDGLMQKNGSLILDQPSFEFLRGLFKREVRCPPAAASWFMTWVEYLESIDA